MVHKFQEWKVLKKYSGAHDELDVQKGMYHQE